MFDVLAFQAPTSNSKHAFGVAKVDELQAAFQRFIAEVRSEKIWIGEIEQHLVAKVNDFPMRSFTITYYEEVDSAT